MKLSSYLEKIEACKEAVDWSRQYDSLDPYEALKKGWNECDNGGWMLWFAGKIWNEYTREMRLAACDIAESVVHLPGKHEKVCRETIAIARRYANGEATDEELRAAADSATHSARSEADWVTLSAYSACSAACSAADSATHSAADSAAYWAARSAAYWAARVSQQIKNAELTRKWITADMVGKQVKLKGKK